MFKRGLANIRCTVLFYPRDGEEGRLDVPVIIVYFNFLFDLGVALASQLIQLHLHPLDPPPSSEDKFQHVLDYFYRQDECHCACYPSN